MCIGTPITRYDKVKEALLPFWCMSAEVDVRIISAQVAKRARLNMWFHMYCLKRGENNKYGPAAGTRVCGGMPKTREKTTQPLGGLTASLCKTMILDIKKRSFCVHVVLSRCITVCSRLLLAAGCPQPCHFKESVVGPAFP